jgi:hypothetical protein
MKLKEAYNYGRHFPASKSQASEDVDKISAHLEQLRGKEQASVGNASILLHDMIKLHARELWLKDAGRRRDWNDNYQEYLKYEIKPMLIDDFVDKFAAHLKKLLQSYTY